MIVQLIILNVIGIIIYLYTIYVVGCGVTGFHEDICYEYIHGKEYQREYLMIIERNIQREQSQKKINVVQMSYKLWIPRSFIGVCIFMMKEQLKDAIWILRKVLRLQKRVKRNKKKRKHWKLEKDSRPEEPQVSMLPFHGLLS